MGAPVFQATVNVTQAAQYINTESFEVFFTHIYIL